MGCLVSPTSVVKAHNPKGRRLKPAPRNHERHSILRSGIRIFLVTSLLKTRHQPDLTTPRVHSACQPRVGCANDRQGAYRFFVGLRESNAPARDASGFREEKRTRS